MGAAVFLHEGRRPPGELPGDLEALHAPGQAHHRPALGRAHASRDLGKAHGADRRRAG